MPSLGLFRRKTANLTLVLAIAITVATTGCGGGKKESAQGSPSKTGSLKSETSNTTPKTTPPVDPTITPPNNGRGQLPHQPRDEPWQPPRILGDLIHGEEGEKPFMPAKLSIDETRVASKGIRKNAGKHLVLYTDLPPSEDVDELPAIFDQAVPQWCEYFGVDPSKVADWQLTAFLMNEKERFQASGLLPDDLPPFLHGFQLGHEIWLYEQPSDYYRRHLVLHEGTHGFMNWHLGGAGPPWYMEGIAELFGTHRWEDGKLSMRHTIRNKEDAEFWGRVRIIKDRFAMEKAMLPREIMQFGPRAHLQVEPYAWCWAVAEFFDNHPKYQDRFRALPTQVTAIGEGFNTDFIAALEPDWPQIDEQWQLFVAEMDYGYDVARAAVEYKPGEPLPAAGKSVTIAADRGWQSAGIRLEAGTTYRISATGRYQIGAEPMTWWCEPGGVTIHYYRGNPLGMLTGALREDDKPLAGLTPLANPAPIGLAREITPSSSGTLYLRINESPAALSDNEGELTVRIEIK